jgi:hypothetical protein
MFRFKKAEYSVTLDKDVEPVVQAFVRYERMHASYESTKRFTIFAICQGMVLAIAGGHTTLAASLVFVPLFVYSIDRWALSLAEDAVKLRLQAFRDKGGNVRTILEDK